MLVTVSKILVSSIMYCWKTEIDSLENLALRSNKWPTYSFFQRKETGEYSAILEELGSTSSSFIYCKSVDDVIDHFYKVV